MPSPRDFNLSTALQGALFADQNQSASPAARWSRSADTGAADGGRNEQSANTPWRNGLRAAPETQARGQYFHRRTTRHHTSKSGYCGGTSHQPLPGAAVTQPAAAPFCLYAGSPDRLVAAGTSPTVLGAVADLPKTTGRPQPSASTTRPRTSTELELIATRCQRPRFRRLPLPLDFYLFGRRIVLGCEDGEVMDELLHLAFTIS